MRQSERLLNTAILTKYISASHISYAEQSWPALSRLFINLIGWMIRVISEENEAKWEIAHLSDLGATRTRFQKSRTERATKYTIITFTGLSCLFNICSITIRIADDICMRACTRCCARPCSSTYLLSSLFPDEYHFAESVYKVYKSFTSVLIYNRPFFYADKMIFRMWRCYGADHVSL